MRVYRAPRIRRKWSDDDRARAKFLFDEGLTNAEIAAALGRKPAAVCAWIHHNLRIIKPVEPIEYLQAKVTGNQVAEFYSLGWRFVGTADGLHVCEWRSSTEPRWPSLAEAA